MIVFYKYGGNRNNMFNDFDGRVLYIKFLEGAASMIFCPAHRAPLPRENYIP